jgi:DNA-binding CsgD family transcriptional regulator
MLLGRARELDRISRLVENVRRRDGGALLLIGEPGIGKTTLLGRASTESEDVRVIRTSGVDAERNLPYVSLAELIDPLLNGLGALPERQANAIESALALRPSPGAATDRFATCAAFLRLLTNAAETTPLLVLVDDAQWLDAPSAECLAYAARRLSGTRIGMLAAARPGGQDGPLLGSPEPERLELSRLTPDDARTLIRGSAPDATGSVIDALVDAAAGNPLALNELPSRLTAEQRLGTAPINYQGVVGTALAEAFEAEIRALDAEARSAVVLASCATGRELAPVVSAGLEIGIDPEAFERAESAQVIALSGDRIGFSHPLVKAAAYEYAAPAERRRAHRALSAHCSPDARAWHLAAATIGPDEEVAKLLDGAAERASARGAHSVAADALARAVDFSEEDRGAARRRYGAALAAALGGAYDRCAALLDSGPEIGDPLLRARVRHAFVVVKMTGGLGLAPDAHSQLEEEADRVSSIDPATAAPMLADASLLAGTSGQFRAASRAAGRAAAAVPDRASTIVRCQVKAMEGCAAALTGAGAEARDALDDAGRLLAQIDVLSPAIQSVVLGLHTRVCTGQELILRAELDRLEELARASDTFGLLPYLLAVSADVSYRIGAWEDSGEVLSSARLAEEYGQYGILPYSLVVSGQILAVRGRTSEARADLQRGIELAEQVGSTTVVAWGHSVLGLLELGHERAEQAVAELVRVATFAAESGLEDPAYIPWAPDLIEAYVRIGQTEDAEHLASALAARARRANVPLSLALAARGLGLVAGEDFESHFDSALGHHEDTATPFQTARTLLAYGSRLHRSRRRIEARKRLRSALEIFEALGADPWIERAKSELRASGAVKREPMADPDELSAQEIRVARAVAGGATNKQVAAKMFLSPKTIDFHLGRVYRKLGIHSRTELAGLVATGALDEAASARPSPTRTLPDRGDD